VGPREWALLLLISSILLCHTLTFTSICGEIGKKTGCVSLRNGSVRRNPLGWWFLGRKVLKKVSFARILNQPSPVRKSVPAELKNIIKFGRLSFELANAPSSFLAVFSNSKSSFRHNTVPRALVASSTVFSRIKASLI
jgi:hypothetical protein